MRNNNSKIHNESTVRIQPVGATRNKRTSGRAHARARYHDRRGKLERKRGNWSEFQSQMAWKSHFQLVEISKGVHFRIASDNPSMLSVGNHPYCLHWARSRRLKFCTFQHEYQMIIDQLGSLVELARRKQVSWTDLDSIRQNLDRLPEGDIRPVKDRIANASRDLRRRIYGGVRLELGHARSAFKNMVVAIFPQVATFEQQERVAMAVNSSINGCKLGGFGFPAFQSTWLSLDLTDLTTSRLMSGFGSLQSAMVSANKHHDYHFAIEKLRSLRADICPNIESDDDDSPPGGMQANGAPAPESPSGGPAPKLPVHKLSKPIHDLNRVRSKRVLIFS